ncbi:hypothetical protein GCM10015535_29840 [Streptomyces gelaticus]|uniref:Transposase n=1 Tax=Streptomyces gelaticus TaxID=285446 RepID=A0ABQ2W001_9ACTN|nr:hypothetical protein GCM10015535_29840 [Streptomyces gelaticus]
MVRGALGERTGMGLDIGVHGHVGWSSGRLGDGGPTRWRAGPKRLLRWRVGPAKGRPGSETGAYATRVAPAKGIWSIGAIRTGDPVRGAWIIWPLPM